MFKLPTRPVTYDIAKSPFIPPLLSADQRYRIHHGDCITHMPAMPPASIDHAVFSPPFPALYAYTSETADIGNSEELKHEAKLHLSFFYRQLARIVKPGRVIIVHVQQIVRMKRTGGVGLFDFRGLNIRLGERAGLVYEYDWGIRKNPQAQAIRTKSRELQFAGLESDRAKSRGALADYLIKFRARGDNEIPIRDWHDELGVRKPVREPDGSLREIQVTRNKWIEWAESWWGDISETDTLNVKEGRGDDDVKHICPLQLPVIDRIVRLYSNPGEIVFSPFTGIGSEGYTALRLGRRFYGCELKNEYHAAAMKNCERAIGEVADDGVGLFDAVIG